MEICKAHLYAVWFAYSLVSKPQTLLCMNY